MKPFTQIERLREVLNEISHHSAFQSSGRGADNSEAIILAYKGNVPLGDYFLCDCIGNTVDLCYSTKRKYKNPKGRAVYCKVIETIITDARSQLGSPVNNCWQIPWHLL